MIRYLSYFVCSGYILALLAPVLWAADTHITNLGVFPPSTPEWYKCYPASILRWEYWGKCVAAARHNDQELALQFSVITSILGTFLFIVSTATALLIAKYSPQNIRGRRLHLGFLTKMNLKAQLRRAGRAGNIELVRGVKIPAKFETRHWYVVGSVGAGKTVFIRSLLMQYTAATQKNIVLDTKADFVGDLWYYSDNGRKKFSSILNPFEKRSLHWWLGADILSLEDGQMFAEKFVSINPSDAFWGNASLNLLVAIILSLQHDFGTNWSWGELAERIKSPTQAIKEWASKHYMPAAAVFEEDDSKTAQSIRLNFFTDCSDLLNISAYWESATPKDRFSIREWLYESNVPKNVLVGWDSSKAKSSKSWTGAFLDIFGALIASPEYSGEDRVNLILDEFAQLPVMNGVLSAMEVGRSKNVSVLLGIQSHYQLVSIYKERADSIKSLVGNFIFAQMSAGRDADDASRFLGTQTVLHEQRSRSKQGDNISTTSSWVEKEHALVKPEEFSSLIGPTNKGVKLIYTALGLDAFILEIPYPTIKPRRKRHIPKEVSLHLGVAEGKLAKSKTASKQANSLRVLVNKSKM